MNNVYVITKIHGISKYAGFKLDNGRIIHGKYGYFTAAYNAVLNQFGEEPKPPYKVKLDHLGEKYFHVSKIFHRGLWVGVKCGD